VFRSGKFIVLADDLTGAGDSAVALVRAGEEADVFLDGLPDGCEIAGCASADYAVGDGNVAERGNASHRIGDRDIANSDNANRDFAGRTIARVAAVDLHTRDLPVEEAIRLVAKAAASVPAGRTVFKKIDSTLRGHIGAELAALCASLPAQDLPVVCIVAPAFPDLGRTLEDGVLHIHGKAADPSALWHAGAGGCRDGLEAELDAHGFAGTSLSLAQVREGEADALTARMQSASASTRPAIICDAKSNADLQRIAAAAADLPAFCVWVGSGGLAHALAAVQATQHVTGGANTLAATSAIGVASASTPASESRSASASASASTSTAASASKSVSASASSSGSGSASPSVPHGGLTAAPGIRRHRLAVMVGSYSAVAAEQVRNLVDAGCNVHVAVPADELIRGVRPSTIEHIHSTLQEGHDVILAIAAGAVMPELSKRLSSGMAALVADLLPRLSALVCCGGDTSRALLDHIGAPRLRVSPCAEPGATLAWSATHPALRLVMKAGAFGDAQALVRLQTELKGMPPPADPSHT
jgi:4-hydroxythreonine-4-phosphate dehydrogenase